MEHAELASLTEAFLTEILGHGFPTDRARGAAVAASAVALQALDPPADMIERMKLLARSPFVAIAEVDKLSAEIEHLKNLRVLGADRETIETLLDLLNPLHGFLDREFSEGGPEEAQRDDEVAVNVQVGHERDLTQAVMILQDRLRHAKEAAPPPPPDDLLLMVAKLLCCDPTSLTYRRLGTRECILQDVEPDPGKKTACLALEHYSAQASLLIARLSERLGVRVGAPVTSELPVRHVEDTALLIAIEDRVRSSMTGESSLHGSISLTDFDHMMRLLGTTTLGVAGIADLREALAPFAKEAERYAVGGFSESSGLQVDLPGITIADLRRAHSVFHATVDTSAGVPAGK
jgi:hypothetical protein